MVMKTFWQWVVNEGGRRTAGKLPLYPLAYGDIGLYPPGEYITHSADAIYYLGKEDRQYYGQSGPPYNVLHLKVDYPENEEPVYNLPNDTSTQFKFATPSGPVGVPDDSTQPRIKNYKPDPLNVNQDPGKWGNNKMMPSDDPTNTWKNLGAGREGTPGILRGEDSPDPKGG